MTAWLVDTNVVSELARQRPEARVVDFLTAATDAYLSAITLHELRYGVERSPDPRRRSDLQAWLTTLELDYRNAVLPVDRAAASAAGQLRADAAARGATVHLADALIAGTANVHDLTIATRNTRGFDALNVRSYNPWTD